MPTGSAGLQQRHGSSLAVLLEVGAEEQREKSSPSFPRKRPISTRYKLLPEGLAVVSFFFTVFLLKMYLLIEVWLCWVFTAAGALL